MIEALLYQTASALVSKHDLKGGQPIPGGESLSSRLKGPGATAAKSTGLGMRKSSHPMFVERPTGGRRLGPWPSANRGFLAIRIMLLSFFCLSNTSEEACRPRLYDLYTPAAIRSSVF